MKPTTLALVLLFVGTEAGAQYSAATALCLICEVHGAQRSIPMDRALAPPLGQTSTADENGSVAGAVVGGLIGGVVGGVVLGYVAYHASGGGRVCGDDPCGLLGGALGLIFGEMIGMGVGVHIGNGRQGSVLADIGIAISAGWAGVGLGSQLADDAALPVGLVLQLGATIAVERGHQGIRPR